jgi:FKBP-type peptidyl-prolyl cis-trans isomerase
MASIATDPKTIQHFWGITLDPKKPSHTMSLTQAELQITQATLVGAHGSSATVLRAATNFVDALPLCQLGGGDLPRSVLLDLNFFPEDETVTLSVEGPGTLAIAGTLAVMGELPDGGDEGGEGGGGAAAAKPDADRNAARGEAGALGAKGKPAPTFVEMEEEEGDDDDDDEVDEAEQDAMLGSFDEEEEEEGEGNVEENDETEQQQPAAAAPKRKREEKAAKAAAAAAAAAQQQQPPPPPKAKSGAAAPASSPLAAGGGGSGGGAWGPVAQTGGKVQFKDMVVGTGPEARKGARVTVGYRGTLKSGKEFDKNAKFIFKLGFGDVIKGWDAGVVGMRVGGVRELIIHSGAFVCVCGGGGSSALSGRRCPSDFSNPPPPPHTFFFSPSQTLRTAQKARGGTSLRTLRCVSPWSLRACSECGLFRAGRIISNAKKKEALSLFLKREKKRSPLSVLKTRKKKKPSLCSFCPSASPLRAHSCDLEVASSAKGAGSGARSSIASATPRIAASSSSPAAHSTTAGLSARPR